MPESELVRLTSDQVLRAIEEEARELSTSVREPLLSLAKLVDNDLSETNATLALTALALNESEDGQATFRKFRERLAAATESQTGLRISVDQARNRKAERRKVWFEGYATVMEEWQHLAIAAELVGHEPERVVAQSGVLLGSDGKPRRLIGLVAHPLDEKEVLGFRNHLESGSRALREPWELITPFVGIGEDVDDGWRRLRECGVIVIWLSPRLLNKADETYQSIERWLGPRYDQILCVNGGRIDPSLHDLGIFQYCRLLGNELVAKRFSKSDSEALVLTVLLQINVTEGVGKVNFNEEAEINLLHKKQGVASLEFLVEPKASFHRSLEDLRSGAIPPEGTDALSALRVWRDSTATTPYFAVLGEAGIGKTTLLRHFACLSSEERVSNNNIPKVIYIDLRNYSQSIQEGKVPSIEALLDELLSSSWKGVEKQILTAKSVIQMVSKGAILILDGLDEKLTHLSPSQGQALVQQIWSISPPFIDPQTGERPRSGRIIVSCRSHFFSTLREQNAFLTSQYRDNVYGSHYEAMILLPFDDEQVKQYFSLYLGKDKVESAMETLRSIHDLSGLSKRPILLSLIAPEIEKLERMRISGRKVRSIDLYRNLVDEWIVRDDGKHQIDQGDKRRLMPKLAQAMWRHSSREWPWRLVSQWFKEQLADDRTLLYAPDRLPVLQEDLRNATFIVRDERSEDVFRFAHSSLQEFFLAQSLFESLLEANASAWFDPLPSDETLCFLAEMLDEDPARHRKVTELLESPRKQATLMAFRYFLLARERGWHLPQPRSFSLKEQDLSGWTIRGKREDLLDIRGADLTNSQLVGTELKFVDLRGAVMKNVDATSAVFEDVLLADADVEGVVDDLTITRSYSVGRQQHEFGRSHREDGIYSLVKVQVTEGHEGRVTAAEFSPDGLRALTGSVDGAILWEIETGRELRRFGGDGAVYALAFSPNSEKVVIGSEKGAVVWEVETGRRLRQLTDTDAKAVAFTSDGELVLASVRSGVVLWDHKTGRDVLWMENDGNVSDACISSDGRLVVAASKSGVSLWDTGANRELGQLENKRGVSTICFSPNGRTILMCSPDNAVISDAEAELDYDFFTPPSSSVVFEGAGGQIHSAKFSPDGRHVLLGSDQGAVLRVVHDRWTSRYFCEGRPVYVANFSSDGTRVLLGSDFGATILNIESGKELRDLRNRGSFHAAAISDDGLKVASASEKEGAILWDSSTGREIKRIKIKGDVYGVSFSKGGGTAVISSRTGAICWDINSNMEELRLGTGAWIRTASFSPDGQKMVTGSDGGGGVIWDAKSGAEIASLKGGNWVRSAAFSPNGDLLVTGSEQGAFLWNADTGTQVHRIGPRDWVNVVAYSPDGKLIFTGSDSTYGLWEASSGRMLRQLGADFNVMSACFSSDGRQVAIGSDCDGMFWDVLSGQKSRFAEGAIRSISFSSDGSQMVTSSATGITVWETETGIPKLELLPGAESTQAVFDYSKNRFAYYGEDTWRVAGWVGLDASGRSRWLMPEEYIM